MPAGPTLVLVVDDDVDIRETLASVLAERGYGVATATNGADALAQLHGGLRPDVILLDIMMPVMDGWAFRSAQVQDPAFTEIPVVVLSAHALARGAAFELGVTAFLAKPVRLDALLATLRRILAAPPAPTPPITPPGAAG